MDKSLKKQLSIPFQLWRVVISAIMVIYAFIFFGLLLFAFLELRTTISFSDIAYSVAYIGLGTIVTLVIIQRLWFLYQKGALSKMIERWWVRRWLYLWASVFFVALYFLRHTFPSLLLYAGFMIGSFFIKLARNAYLFLFTIDLYDYQIALFAWAFQWQFVYALLDFFVKLFRKK